METGQCLVIVTVVCCGNSVRKTNTVSVSLQVYVPYMFWITVLDAFYQSVVCFFVPYFVSTLYQSIKSIASFIQHV